MSQYPRSKANFCRAIVSAGLSILGACSDSTPSALWGNADDAREAERDANNAPSTACQGRWIYSLPGMKILDPQAEQPTKLGITDWGWINTETANVKHVTRYFIHHNNYPHQGMDLEGHIDITIDLGGPEFLDQFPVLIKNRFAALWLRDAAEPSGQKRWWEATAKHTKTLSLKPFFTQAKYSHTYIKEYTDAVLATDLCNKVGDEYLSIWRDNVLQPTNIQTHSHMRKNVTTLPTSYSSDLPSDVVRQIDCIIEIAGVPVWEYKELKTHPDAGLAPNPNAPVYEVVRGDQDAQLPDLPAGMFETVPGLSLNELQNHIRMQVHNMGLLVHGLETYLDAIKESYNKVVPSNPLGYPAPVCRTGE